LSNDPFFTLSSRKRNRARSIVISMAKQICRVTGTTHIFFYFV
jgi:hypothetical protein